MLSYRVVVVQLIKCFGKHFLPVGYFEDSGDVKLVVIGTMRTFKVGVFFRVFQVILDEFASETGKQLSKFCDLVPGFSPEFFSMVDSKNDLV